MPTGLTYPIEEQDNYSFRAFALSCARQFGACIHMRDESLETPPRHRTVSNYHGDELKKARAKLIELEAASDGSLRAIYAAEVAKREKDIADSKDRHKVKGARYAAMRAKVEAWNPPTADHEGLKKLMLDQIAMSFSEESRWVEPPMKPFEEWRAATIDWARRDVNYHTEELAKEEARVTEANQWIDQLFASLEGT